MERVVVPIEEYGYTKDQKVWKASLAESIRVELILMLKKKNIS